MIFCMLQVGGSAGLLSHSVSAEVFSIAHKTILKEAKGCDMYTSTYTMLNPGLAQ